MLMMSLCPNSWWWCCLRSSVGACDDGDVALTSPEALFCNQNYTFTDRGRLQAKALLVPTTTSALKTSCHLLYTQHRLRSLLIIYLFSICLQFRWIFVQGRTFDFCWKTVSVEFSLRKHPKLLPIADFLRRSQRSFALSQVRAFSKNQFWIHSHTNLLT